MRAAYLNSAAIIKKGREYALEGEHQRALDAYQQSLELLRTLPPERTRDVLLAHTHLAYYQTLNLLGQHTKSEQEHLRLGVSYARSTRDPLARAIAEECLSGLQVVL